MDFSNEALASDNRSMLACCNVGTRPNTIEIERMDNPENDVERERPTKQNFKNTAVDAYTE